MASYPSECTNAGRRKAWVAGSTDKRLPMRSHTLTSTHAPRRICSTAITQEASESSTKGILSGSLQGTQGSDTLLWLDWMSAAKDGGPAGAGNRRSLHSRHPQEASEGPPLYQTSPQSKADPAGAKGEDSWGLDPTTPTAEIRDALSLSLLFLFCFGHSVGLAGPWFPNQGSNLCPLQ